MLLLAVLALVQRLGWASRGKGAVSEGVGFVVCIVFLLAADSLLLLGGFLFFIDGCGLLLCSLFVFMFIIAGGFSSSSATVIVTVTVSLSLVSFPSVSLALIFPYSLPGFFPLVNYLRT